MRKYLKTFLVAGIIAGLAAVAAQAYGQTSSQNLLVCGDISVCPNQRGTASVGGDIVGTAVMTLDFWSGIGGTATALNVSAVAPSAGSTIQGVTLALQMQRKSGNTILLPLNVGQVLDTDASTSLQGKTVCLSFDSMKGANFSANLAAFTWSAFSGTGAAQGYASMVAGTWTGTSTVATGTVTATTLAQTTSSCFAIPGTATEVGINFAFTPVGTAGANDWIQLARMQLAVVNASPASAQAPVFIYRTKQTEQDLAFRRAYVIAEPATGIDVPFTGFAASATACIGYVPFFQPMRAAPTLVASTIVAGTNWKAVAVGVAANLSAIATSVANTAFNGVINITTAGMTAGQACGLQGVGGGSTLTFSADLL